MSSTSHVNAAENDVVSAIEQPTADTISPIEQHTADTTSPIQQPTTDDAAETTSHLCCHDCPWHRESSDWGEPIHNDSLGELMARWGDAPNDTDCSCSLDYRCDLHGFRSWAVTPLEGMRQELLREQTRAEDVLLGLMWDSVYERRCLADRWGGVEEECPLSAFLLLRDGHA